MSVEVMAMVVALGALAVAIVALVMTAKNRSEKIKALKDIK